MCVYANGIRRFDVVTVVIRLAYGFSRIMARCGRVIQLATSVVRDVHQKFVQKLLFVFLAHN
jgi:predicted histidine transporter YuiF (NhaC family)